LQSAVASPTSSGPERRSSPGSSSTSAGWKRSRVTRPSRRGTDVAVLIRHFGFWSLNGCRVLYEVGGQTDTARFGFAYGTLTNHAESGEELFEVFIDPRTQDVVYRIRAISWPQTALTRVGQPVVRALQARFRRDSVAAIARATHASVAPR
jgi:uncharacterized protein (UPF0548 family)